MSSPTTPVPVALILCDDLIVQQNTDKITLVGIFDRLRATEFPSPPRSIHAFVSLIDSIGDVRLRLVCTKADSGEEVYALEGTAFFPDRLTTVNVHFTARNLQFPAPEVYYMQLYGDGVFIAERKLTVVEP